jgi:polar amino acid transport system permease protein
MFDQVTESLSYLWNYLPGFISASWLAFEISVVTIVLSWLVGLVLALGQRSRLLPVRKVAALYIWFIRGTPALIQVFIVYFGLPQLGIKLDPFSAGILALAFGSGAYVAEIIRAGLKAIPRGQFDGAHSIGLTRRQLYQLVILPQVVRIVVPALTNEAINTLKNTSLLSTITVVELTLHTQTMIAATFRPFEFYILAALLYLLMTSALSRLANWYEKAYPSYS